MLLVLKFIKKEIDAVLPDVWYQPNMVGVSPFPKCEEEFEIIANLLEENADKLPDIQVYRHPDCFDIIPVGIDKKAGVHFLAQKLSLMRDEIVAVGDSMNDYPMFAYAGLSLGVKVKDESQVNRNFATITEVLDYLDAKPESDDWYTLALEDMDEFVESQGIYLRQ